MAQRVADFGTKFKNPTFAAMADAVGVRGGGRGDDLIDLAKANLWE
jgi:hypothetical protein